MGVNFSRMDDLFPKPDVAGFEPTRAAGLNRLEAFQSAMGRQYASERNHDHGPSDRSNVSALSPWVRTRTLLEEELARTALDRYALSTAEKFVQEVCWRTYFKGWLEHRPAVWDEYRKSLQASLDAMERDADLRARWQAAVEGRTGIDCFDAWARELVETGYLHNHARMWFASIWLFTLKLPLELGADFFLRHLMDGDAASNTLSWRWVGGLHTPGKTYLARQSNIEKYTDGRFSPEGLAREAPALNGFANPPRGKPGPGDRMPEGDVALLLTEEDYHVETLLPEGRRLVSLAAVSFAEDRSPLGAGAEARRFVEGARDDALARGEAALGCEALLLPGGEAFVEAAVDWASASGAKAVVTGFAPTGWVRPRLAALRAALQKERISLVERQRDWDAAFWPHATAGFFKLKKAMPDTLASLGLPV